MPKKQQDLCMLCGGSPCQCDGLRKKKSSRVTRKVKSPKTTIETVRVSSRLDSATEDSPEDVFGEIPEATSKFKSVSHSEEEPDLSYFAALRILYPLLSVNSRKEVDKELNRPYPQSIDRRIADWKKNVLRRSQ